MKRHAESDEVPQDAPPQKKRQRVVRLRVTVRHGDMRRVVAIEDAKISIGDWIKHLANEFDVKEASLQLDKVGASTVRSSTCLVIDTSRV